MRLKGLVLLYTLPLLAATYPTVIDASNSEAEVLASILNLVPHGTYTNVDSKNPATPLPAAATPIKAYKIHDAAVAASHAVAEASSRLKCRPGSRLFSLLWKQTPTPDGASNLLSEDRQGLYPGEQLQKFSESWSGADSTLPEANDESDVDGDALDAGLGPPPLENSGVDIPPDYLSHPSDVDPDIYIDNEGEDEDSTNHSDLTDNSSDRTQRDEVDDWTYTDHESDQKDNHKESATHSNYRSELLL